MMTEALEMMESSYHPTIKTLIGNVFNGKTSWFLSEEDIKHFASSQISEV